MTLHYIQDNNSVFSIIFQSSRDILLVGIGVFMPFGSDVHDNICIKGKAVINPKKN